MDASVYEFIVTATTYTEAMNKLEKFYDKKINKIYARCKLSNEKRQDGESMDSYVLRLMIMAIDCGFSDITALEYKNDAVLQSFVSGLEDPYVRQRILEIDIVTLEEALKKAEVLKLAKNDASTLGFLISVPSPISVPNLKYGIAILREYLKLGGTFL